MKKIPMTEFVGFFNSMGEINVFAGSAISKKSGMPLKDEFIKKPLLALSEYSETLSGNYEKYLTRLIGPRDGNTIGGEPPLNKTMWMERFVDILRIPCKRFYHESLPWELLGIFKEGEPTSPHRAVASDIGKRFRCVFTTNFDLLIERASKKPNGEPIRATVPGIIDGDNNLIKLHGCISDLESLVVTTSGITGNLSAEAISILHAAMTARPTLFIGYGGWDEDVQKALKTEDFRPREIFWCVRRDTGITENNFLEEISGRHDVTFVVGDLFDFIEGAYGLSDNEVVPDLYGEYARSVIDKAAVDSLFVEHLLLYIYERTDLRYLIIPLYEELIAAHKSSGIETPFFHEIQNRALYARSLRHENDFARADKVFSKLLKDDLKYLRRLKVNEDFKTFESDYYLHTEDRAENSGMMVNLLKIRTVNILIKAKVLLFYFYYYLRALHQLKKCYEYRDKNKQRLAQCRITLRTNDLKFRRYMHFEGKALVFLEKIPLFKRFIIKGRIKTIGKIISAYEAGLAVAESLGARGTASHYYRKLMHAYLYKFQTLMNLKSSLPAEEVSEDRKKIDGYIGKALIYFDMMAFESAVGYTASIAGRYVMFFKEYDKARDLLCLALMVPREKVTEDDIEKTKKAWEKETGNRFIEPSGDYKQYRELFNKVLTHFRE